MKYILGMETSSICWVCNQIENLTSSYFTGWVYIQMVTWSLNETCSATEQLVSLQIRVGLDFVLLSWYYYYCNYVNILLRFCCVVLVMPLSCVHVHCSICVVCWGRGGQRNKPHSGCTIEQCLLHKGKQVYWRLTESKLGWNIQK